MTTGRSFRQRPLDAHKELPIVRDESLLDSTDGLPMKEHLEHDHKNDSKAESKESKKDPQKAKFIPIPGVIPVSTYDLEYLPVFKERNTYIRGRGGIGYDDPTLVEYDIDTDDELWLKNFNKDQEKLTASKFEAMLWKLDVANAEATDKSLAFQTPAERLTPEVCGTTEFLTKENALAVLSETCPARDTIAASVYDYWLEKRNMLKQPLLRRLQAPTPLNNGDPFRVFRLRDKIHRPQTRRRRENNVDSYDKLQMISTNIKIALDLFENVVKRERKKRDMTYVVTDWQQLQIKQKFNPKSDQDAIEQEYLTAAKLKNVRRPVGFEKLPEAAPGATNALLEFRNKKNKRRKRLGLEAQLNAIAQLPPPVLEPEPQILFSNEVSPAAYSALLTTSGARTSKLRVGRGGRFVMDRCRPFTWDIPTEDQDVESPQVYEMSNPYSQWAGKSDLAEAALSRLEIASGKLHVACVKSEENDLKAIGNASAEN